MKERILKQLKVKGIEILHQDEYGVVTLVNNVPRYIPFNEIGYVDALIERFAATCKIAKDEGYIPLIMN